MRCFPSRINGGFKGLDPVGNIACPHIDFLTLHICELLCSCFPQQECVSCHAMLLVHRLLAAAALTIHNLKCVLVLASADPDNWAIQSWEFNWVNANVIRDRAAIAHSQNKPFIIEETGMKVLACPIPLLQYIFAACLSKCFPPLHMQMTSSSSLRVSYNTMAVQRSQAMKDAANLCREATSPVVTSS